MISLEQLPDVLSEYVHGSDHPDIQVYRRDVMDPGSMDVWTWRRKHFCDLGGFYGKRILEVGAGFGWDAVGIALIGDNQVVATDILPSMIDGMSQCLASMEAKGKAIEVTPLQGDICELDLEDESFDGIFSSEAIEHVHDLQRMFDNCFRLLRPGGKAVLVNDSNKFNEEACRHSWDSWKDRDESWDHVNWLKSEVRPVEHSDARPYAVMREDMIRAAAPDLDDADVARLRAATAGMMKPEIEEAVARFRQDGALPTPDPFSWCRNPETGEYSERLLDPFELKAMLERSGFKVQLRHLFRKAPYRFLNAIPLRPLNERLFAMRSHFVLVATKPGG
jgi:ubiquinone/menaquinone biosynthesis C-methylase UbiE